MTLALATMQESQPAWRKADLIRCLGELLPDNTICRDDQSAAEEVTRLLGADQAQLQAQLSAEAQDPDAAQQMTSSGLRLDQAAAAFAVLTTNRRAANHHRVRPAAETAGQTARSSIRAAQDRAVPRARGLPAGAKFSTQGTVTSHGLGALAPPPKR
jgi:hypothetical protein